MVTPLLLFCLRFLSGPKPHPLIIIRALDYWGDGLTLAPCVNVIEICPVARVAETETHFDEKGDKTKVVIRIDTSQITKYGLFYNVLLHELGHANGYRHPQPPDNSIMSYAIVVSNGTIMQNALYFDNPKLFIPFSPFESLAYSGAFF